MAANRMSRFEIFIGVWNTTGDVLATEKAPATTLVATDIYRWLPGNRFIAHEADARFGGKPTRSLEILGHDAKKRKHFAHAYDDQGVAEVFEVELAGRRWRIHGATTRFDGRFDASHATMRGLWELKSSKGRWQPWIELALARA